MALEHRLMKLLEGFLDVSSTFFCLSKLFETPSDLTDLISCEDCLQRRSEVLGSVDLYLVVSA